MTFTAMTKTIAKMIVQDNAYATERRYIKGDADLTEYDEECVDLYSRQIRHLLMNSDGCKWNYVLNGFKIITGRDFHLGFKAQDKIINVCKEYGIVFTL